MANVERMLQNEKQTMKSLPKSSAVQEFDLNEGIVSVTKTVKPKTGSPTKVEAGKAQPKSSGNVSKQSTTGNSALNESKMSTNEQFSKAEGDENID